MSNCPPLVHVISKKIEPCGICSRLQIPTVVVHLTFVYRSSSGAHATHNMMMMMWCPLPIWNLLLFNSNKKAAAKINITCRWWWPDLSIFGKIALHWKPSLVAGTHFVLADLHWLILFCLFCSETLFASAYHVPDKFVLWHILYWNSFCISLLCTGQFCTMANFVLRPTLN